MNTMDDDHRRDYAGKRLADDAARAITAALDAPELEHRLGPIARDDLEQARARLQALAEHIVAAWN